MDNKENVETTEKAPQVYEVGYLILPIVSEADLGAEVTAVRDAIESSGANIIADEYPKHTDLAYTMVKTASNKRAKYASAYFGWMKFTAEPKGAAEINSALKKNDNVLRYILIKTVRESTLVPKKVFREMRGEGRQEPEARTEEKPPMSEEELDKTIEELVIS